MFRILDINAEYVNYQLKLDFDEYEVKDPNSSIGEINKYFVNTDYKVDENYSLIVNESEFKNYEKLSTAVNNNSFDSSQSIASVPEKQVFKSPTDSLAKQHEQEHALYRRISNKFPFFIKKKVKKKSKFLFKK